MKEQRKVLISKTIKMSLEASVVSMPKRELKSWDSCRVSCEFYAQLFHSQNMHLSNRTFYETQVKYKSR